MTDLQTAAQQALEALEWHYRQGHSNTLGGFRLKIDEKALRNLKAALAQQAEPQDAELSAALGWPGGISEPVLDRKTLLQMVAALMQDKLWEDHRVRHLWDHTLAQQAEPKGGGNLPPPLQAEPVQEPDLSRCPQCNGPADNGHDRSIPPNPYFCTRCMAEMPQPSYNATVVDDAHPNGIPLEQWQNKPVHEPVAWIHTDPDKPRVRFLEWREDEPGYRGRWIKTPLYTTPPQRLPLTKEQLLYIYNQLPNWGMDMDSLPQGLEKFARAIERAHGIGGQP